MTTLKRRYESLLPSFVRVLPMEDPMFLANLIASNMFPGDTMGAVVAQPTKDKKAAEFLSKCIEPEFSEDGNSNKMLEKLLVIMEGSSFEPNKELAKQLKHGGN